MFVQNHFQQGVRYKLMVSCLGDTVVSGVYQQEFNGKVEFTDARREVDNSTLLPGVTNSILKVWKDDIISYGEDV